MRNADAECGCKAQMRTLMQIKKPDMAKPGQIKSNTKLAFRRHGLTPGAEVQMTKNLKGP